MTDAETRTRSAATRKVYGTMKLRWQSGAGRLNISLVTEFD